MTRQEKKRVFNSATLSPNILLNKAYFSLPDGRVSTLSSILPACSHVDLPSSHCEDQTVSGCQILLLLPQLDSYQALLSPLHSCSGYIS